MMKKAFAIAMAGLLALSCASVSFAGEEEVMELDYTMIDPDVYEGTWISAFGVFDLYLPSDWNVLYNAEDGDEPEDNVYFLAQNEDETRSVAISYVQTEDMDLEKLAASLEEQGMANITNMVINEIPVVGYEYEDEDVTTAGIATIGDMGGLYNVTIGSVAGDEEFQAIGQNIIFSFSATEYEEAETETEA